MTIFFSCENALENEIQSSQENIMVAAESKVGTLDSLISEEAQALEETEELKALKELIGKLKRPRVKVQAYDYDENFSTNIWAIRELPITLQARGQANTGNRYLSTNGKGKEVTLVNSARSDDQKFYLRVLPASSGIPYLIYSYKEKTPISVGQYSSNPDNKILFTTKDESGSMYSASWDLIPSESYKGYFAIQSESYLGQSDPNNMWSVFNYVLEVRNDNKLGYAKYSKKAQQEFLPKPDARFVLQEITYDTNSAIITEGTPLKIVSNDRNISVEPKTYSIPVSKSFTETSYFSEKKSIDFNLSNPSKCYQRPTVEANRIVLPNTTTKYDAMYKTTSTQNITKTLSFNIEGNAPERCLIEVTSSVKTYNVSINYTIKGTYSDREIKLSGTWRGTVILDPQISAPTHIPRYFDLESGEEIYFLRSALKTTFNK
ncbi:MAG: hypothetical protein LBT43_03875 [Prevotella sp.]|nr:hypothetical protein [Prevotella sp.]